MELISQAEYARRRGVSKVAVHHAVKSGRIALVDGKVAVDQADKEWQAKSRPRMGSEPAGKGKRQEPPTPPGSEEGSITLPADFFAERARKERALADKAEMEAAKMRGDLIEAAAVRAEFAKQAGAVRDGLLNIPARLAAILAAEPDVRKVQALLDSELRAVLAQFVGDGT